MKALICIKIVPEPQGLVVSKSEQTVKETTQRIINPFDEFAIEEALQLKEKGIINTIYACSVCRQEDINVLKRVYAMGVDEIYAIVSPEIDKLDHFVISRIISDFIKSRDGFEFIFCGARSPDGISGQTAIRIALWLQIPYNFYTQRLTTRPDKLPCLFIIKPDINKPRLPSAISIIKSARKQIPVINAQSLIKVTLQPKLIVSSSYLAEL